MKSKFLLSLILIFSLTACSNMWLGTSGEDLNLKGKRLNIISSSYQISPEDMLKDDIDLDTNLGFQNIERNWKLSVGSYTKELFSYDPIYDNGFIFTLSDKNVISCIDLKLKKIKWQVRVSPKNEDITGIFGGGLTLGSNSILVATGFGDILSISKENGGMFWRYSSISPFYSAPYLKDGIVFATNRKNELIALRENNGETLWKQKGTPEEVSILSNIKIVGSSELVIPTYTSGEVFALVPSNGKMVWSESLNTSNKISSLTDISNMAFSSIIANDTLITSSLGSKIIALNIKDGNRLWQKKISPIKTPISIGDYIFVLTSDYKLLALSSLNGGIYWQTDLSQLYDKEVNWSNLSTYNNNIVLVNSNNDVIFISAKTGKINLKKNISYFSLSEPLFIDNTMFILDGNNNLISYKLY